MARPKLPPEQRRRLTMTVRIRQDLDEGFAAVALLRGTTKSGLDDRSFDDWDISTMVRQVWHTLAERRIAPPS